MQHMITFKTDSIDWNQVEAAIFRDGFARLPGMLDAAGCRALASLYGQDRLFRSRIDMARHAFGRGTYAYFAAPCRNRSLRCAPHSMPASARSPTA